ncbi:hypothetical protein DPMN_010475 [Dreissena polymorpha]|uniref:Uncharacterized protein n=1 Tax=Dreissena polymorpha TaxID=45954 RepID=A0A9D4N279_DREPO|nr:hypothetical protein DPMN_010475 [Dreissena polymorpha]
MARQRTTRLEMRPCIVKIDRIVIRQVQYQLEVNGCRNEEANNKRQFGWVWPMWAGHPMIDRIVIRIVQYQLEVKMCRNEEIIVKDNFVWVWPIWAGRPRIDRIVIRKVQYQLEVNRCRNEEVIVKCNFEWVWPMWVARLRVGNGAMHIEIDRIVIREFQYEFVVNRCRNEEIIVKGNFGWVWSVWGGGAPGLVMGPCIFEIDRIVIREVQYQFEVNRCRNEEVNFQGSSAYSVGGDSGQDGQTDGRTYILILHP